MLRNSKRGFLATARWMLALWVTLTASSMILPCGKAFALPNPGAQIASYNTQGENRAAREGVYAADEAPTLPSGSSYCVDIPNPVPLKAQASATPASADFFAPTANHYAPIPESAPAARIVARTPAALPRVFLKTSRLLI